MKRVFLPLFAVMCLAMSGVGHAADTKPPVKAATPDWSMNATIIEACSCPMFCQCYFNSEPAGHGAHGGGSEGMSMGAEHFCKFNNAFRVNKGNYGSTSLDGAKFWVYGDLGSDFSKGEMAWAKLTYDTSLTPEQRQGIAEIVGHTYPVKFKSFTTGEGSIEWVAGADEAYALLDGGKTAEVRLSTRALNRNAGSAPMVLTNLKYWGVPRNDGFVLMPNTVEAMRVGEMAYEFKGTNGFMITIDINSKDVK